MVNGFRYFGLRAALLGTVMLAGCTQFPELDEGREELPKETAYPRLLPLDTLLTEQPRRAEVAVIGKVDGRVAGLTARADRLRVRRAGEDRALDRRIARLRQKAAALKDL